jgi:Arc/MetJ family transcription regulator
MRTTIDIPEELLVRAMSVSGAKTKREAVRWALEEALRHRAIEDLLTLERPIDFAITPGELEAREVKAQYGAGRRRRSR